MSYSTQKITSTLLEDIKTALHKVSYGSIEIIVQDSVVTQITVRNIKKTSYKLSAQVRENGNSNREKKPTVTRTNGHSKHNVNRKINVLTIAKE